MLLQRSRVQTHTGTRTKTKCMRSRLIAPERAKADEHSHSHTQVVFFAWIEMDDIPQSTMSMCICVSCVSARVWCLQSKTATRMVIGDTISVAYSQPVVRTNNATTHDSNHCPQRMFLWMFVRSSVACLGMVCSLSVSPSHECRRAKWFAFSVKRFTQNGSTDHLSP